MSNASKNSEMSRLKELDDYTLLLGIKQSLELIRDQNKAGANWFGTTSEAVDSLGWVVELLGRQESKLLQPDAGGQSLRPQQLSESDGHGSAVMAVMPQEPTLQLLDVGWGICGGDGHASAQPNRQKINMATANYKALFAAVSSRQPVGASKRYTVEPHGQGFAVYDGRDAHHHGLNLAHLTETTPEIANLIERGLNSLVVNPVGMPHLAKKVTGYRVEWPREAGEGMRCFYSAEEWERCKGTVDFFGGKAIALVDG